MTEQGQSNHTGTGNAPLVGEDDKTDDVFIPLEIFISNHDRRIMEFVLDFGVSFVLSIFGIVSNIVILVVFSRQGFRKSVNISMSFIAVWDLIKCLAAASQRVGGPIGLVSPSTAESWANISTATMLYLLTFANYVSCALAAYVALERCLCVASPFKVKLLLTSKVTVVVMVALSTVVFSCFIVIFAIYDIAWVFSFRYNTTIAIYKYSYFFEQHHGPLMSYYNMIGVLWPTLSFVLILVCTVIIVHHLRKSAKFRARGVNTESLPAREQQVVRMLLVIIIAYVICLFPRIVLYLTKYFVYEFYFLRKYHNIFVVYCYWIVILDLVNANINLFIFTTMNFSFRTTLLEMMHLQIAKKIPEEK